MTFAENVEDKTVTVWCIDKNTTNPYRLHEKLGIVTPTEEQIKLLREEGNLKPVKVQKGNTPLTLQMTPNSTYFITVE